MIQKTELTSMFKGLATGLPWRGPNRFLILLAVGLWCIQLHGATNVFETPPPKIGSIQWEKIQRLTKERQELYRKRVAVPGAMAEDVPKANGALFAYPQKAIVVQPQSVPAASGMFLKFLFYTAVLAFVGILIFRKFAHRLLVDLNQRFNPWALEPVTGRGFREKVRAEEEAFTRFLAT